MKIIAIFISLCLTFSCLSVLAIKDELDNNITIDDVHNQNISEDTIINRDGDENTDNTDNNSEEVDVTDNENSPDIDIADKEVIYELYFDSIIDAYEVINLQDYISTNEERETIYDTETFIRRDGTAGNSHIIYEIPYLSEFKAISCHRPTDVAEMVFEISKDAVTWEEIQVDIKTNVEENKWTRLEYIAKDLENVRYLKIIWGEENESINWWNPYFAGVYANVTIPIATELVIETPSEMYIPVYDCVRYKLEAKIIDQIGLNFDDEIKWTLISTEDENIVINKDNQIEISSEMKEDVAFTIKAENSDGSLTVEKTITLKMSVYGDVNGDNSITREDVIIVLDNYGKSVDENNRLCDIDKNGEMDIIDIAYVARYSKITEN